MAWKKMGLIFDLSKHDIPWLKSHAMLPTPLVLEDRIRVYFSGRDQSGQGKVSFIDVRKDNPAEIIYVHDQPLFDVGKIGTFDDSGVLVNSVVENNDLILLYYTAYSQSLKVPYRNSIGVAVSKDGGTTFNRMFEGPIVDRSKDEPYFTISPCVVRDAGKWHMWYASATEWVIADGKPESLYHIKYAFSDNGIDWHRENVSCIEPLKRQEANAKPSVLRDGDILRMWFCYRGSSDFRDGLDSYRIGYAEATIDNPSQWVRDDTKAGISCGPEGFDDKMQAYPSVIDVEGKIYLFYNGNGFGYGGFCCAFWE